MLLCALAIVGCDESSEPMAVETATTTSTTMTPKVLIIGIDGLRPDALMAAQTPAIDALIANGCITLEASAAAETVSGPGWSNVLCGVWPDKHRSVDNRFLITDYQRYPSIFTLAKRARPQIRTALFANWGPIGERILALDSIDHRVSLQDTKNDEPQTVACVETLAHDPLIDLVFYYIGNVDEVGHALGFHRAVPGYIAAIESADALVARVIEAVKARATYLSEDWLIIVVTDHGGTIDLSHGRDIVEHRMIPFIVSGAAAAKGRIVGTVNQVDVAATALTHLNIEQLRAWDLDSHAVGLAADSARAMMLERNLVCNGDAELSSPAAEPAGNRGVAGWRDIGAVSTLAYGAHADFPTAQTIGAPSRGASFIFGGEAGESRIEQRIDLATLAHEIDADHVSFDLRGWLGGFAQQRDLAWIELEWLDEHGGVVGRAELRAVTLEDRTAATGGDAVTMFIERSVNGAVPALSRAATLTLRFERSEGVCDGYADEISLVLHALSTPIPGVTP